MQEIKIVKKTIYTTNLCFLIEINCIQGSLVDKENRKCAPSQWSFKSKNNQFLVWMAWWEKFKKSIKNNDKSILVALLIYNTWICKNVKIDLIIFKVSANGQNHNNTVYTLMSDVFSIEQTLSKQLCSDGPKFTWPIATRYPILNSKFWIRAVFKLLIQIWQNYGGTFSIFPNRNWQWMYNRFY